MDKGGVMEGIEKEKFRVFAEKARADIEKYSNDVKSELYGFGSKFPEMVCRVNDGVFSCWIGNKNYFNNKNIAENMNVFDYHSAAMKKTYLRYLEDSGGPMVAVRIEEKDGGFVNFLVPCPYCKTAMCLLKNFTWHKKEKL
jgi:hypothetical protein